MGRKKVSERLEPITIYVNLSWSSLIYRYELCAHRKANAPCGHKVSGWCGQMIAQSSKAGKVRPDIHCTETILVHSRLRVRTGRSTSWGYIGRWSRYALRTWRFSQSGKMSAGSLFWRWSVGDGWKRCDMSDRLGTRSHSGTLVQRVWVVVSK